MGKRGFAKTVSANRTLLLMLVPALAYTAIFSYAPMAGLVLAFKNYTHAGGIFRSPWAGLDNFRFLFISGKLWPLTRNTLLYNFAFIVIGMVCEVGLAIGLNELRNRVFKRTFQSFTFLPYFISWVVVAAMVQNMLGSELGVLNTTLGIFGGRRVNLYSNASAWPFLLVVLKLWKQTGYGSLVYFVSISAIDPQLYEAASIDGANVWQKTRHVTLAGIVPAMIVMFLLSVGQIFRGDFGLFYQLVGNNGSLLEKADILDLFVYRALSTTGDIGMATAAGLYQSLLCFGTVVAANFLIRRIRPEYSIF
jgi:putative aldouronate transport system permease protein